MTTSFPEVVHRFFDLVAARHDLQRVESNRHVVRYQNDKVFLKVRFDAGRSYELGVEVGQVPGIPGQAERPYNLAEILELQGSSDASFVEGLQVSKPEVLLRVTERLSKIVASGTLGLLDGDPKDFERLAAYRDRATAAYALARELRYARSKAEKAWKKRDFDTVVETYRPVEQYLTPSEQGRLRYAERIASSKENG